MLVERPHLQRRSGLDDVVISFFFTLAVKDQILDPQAGAENLHGRDPSAADARQQALTDDPADGIGKSIPDLRLFFLLKHTERAVDRLAGIDGMQRRQDEVSGFRCGQADFHGLPVAHLADQNDFRRLAQGGPHAHCKVAEIAAEFSLVKCCLAMLVNKFDRIFQGHDVDCSLFVDPVEQRGQRCRFTGPGGAGKDDQTVEFPGHFGKSRREIHAFDARHLGLEPPEHRRDITLLGKNVDPEPGRITERIGKVAGAVGHQVGEKTLVLADQVQREDLGLKRGQLFDRRLHLDRHKLTGRFDLQGFADGDIEVRNIGMGLQQGGNPIIDLGLLHDTLLEISPQPSGIVVYCYKLQKKYNHFHPILPCRNRPKPPSAIATNRINCSICAGMAFNMRKTVAFSGVIVTLWSADNDSQ